MPRKGLLSAFMLYAGICGFIKISLGLVLLVLRYQLVYITIGLILFGMIQLVFFCHANAERGILFFYIVQNVMIVALIVFGLTTFFYNEAIVKIVGIVCFSIGLIMSLANNLFLLFAVILLERSEEEINQTIYHQLKQAIVDDLMKASPINMTNIVQKAKNH